MDEQSIFLQALDIHSLERRDEWLAKVCGNDESKIQRIRQLIKQHENAKSFLENPPEELSPEGQRDSEEIVESHSATIDHVESFGDDSVVVLGSVDQSVLQSIANTLDEVPKVALRESELDEGEPVSRPISPEMPSQSVGSRYRLDGEIARGGMGAVIKGRDSDLGRDLAIKVLLDKHKDNPEVIHRFIEEAQIGGQLQHPGIAPIYELGQFADKRPFFSMKLVKGRTLAKILAERKQPNEDRAKLIGIFDQVCQTMSYAHSRGVIHRDLKPANIMVGAFGEVQVMDWGLAKVLSAGGVADEQKSRMKTEEHSIIQTLRSGVGGDGNLNAGSVGSVGSETQMGSVMGTPAYMPPEQALGEIDRLDERSDVFGLGAILCEILTGAPPYIGENGTEIFRLASRGKLAACFDRLDGCDADEALIELTKQSLDVEPANRPNDATALAGRIANYQFSVEEKLREKEIQRAAQEARATAEALKAKAEHERVKEEIKRRRISLAFAVCVLLLVATGGGMGLWMLRQEANRQADIAATQEEHANEMEDKRDEQRKLVYVAEMNVAGQLLENGDVANAFRLLDRQIPTNGDEDLRCFEWFHYSNLVKTSIEAPSFKVKLKKPYFSKLKLLEQKIIAYDPTGDGAICDNSTKEVTLFKDLLPESHRNDVLRFFKSPNDHFASANGNNVFLWKYEDDQLKQIRNFELEFEFIDDVTLTSNQKIIAVVGRFNIDDKSRVIELRNVDTGDPLLANQHLDQPKEEKTELLFSPDGQQLLAFNSSGNKAYLFAVHSEAEPRELSLEGNFLGTVFSSDSKILVARTRDLKDNIRKIAVWSVDEPGKPDMMSGHTAEIKRMAIHESELLATTSMDHKVKVWDLKTLKEIQTLNGHTNWTAAVAFSPDGKLLATGGADQNLILWSTETWEILETFKGHPGQIMAVTFSDDSNTIVSQSAPDGTILVWQNIKERSVHRIQAQQEVADVVALSPNGEIAATAGREGTVNIWNLATGSRLFQILPEENDKYHKQYYPAIRMLAISPDGQSLAIVTAKGPIEVWGIREKDLLYSLDVSTLGEDDHATCIAFSPDNTKRILVAGTTKGTVLRWNLDSSKEIEKEEPAETAESKQQGFPINDEEKNLVDMIGFSPDGTMLAAGRRNGQLTVWNLEEDTRYDRQVGDRLFRALAFSDSGELAVTTLGDQIQLLDAKANTLKATIADSYGTIVLAYLPNSNELLAGGFDQSIRRYDTSLIKDQTITHPQHYFRGHKATVVSLAVSEDGNTFVSSDDFGVLRVWRRKSNEK